LATNGTYTLTVSVDGSNGLPVIFDDGGHTLVIHGNGATLQRSTAGGTPVFRIFFIDAGDVTISGLTITNGNVTFGFGGGIFFLGPNRGPLTLSDCTVSGNSAESGGGITNLNGTLTLSDCTVSGNSTSGSGGGIYSVGSAPLGATSTVTVSNCTISGNAAESGGGIYGEAENLLGLGSNSIVTVSNSTINGNSAAHGGGIYNFEEQGAVATLDLGSSILNAGGSGANIFNGGGTVTSHGYNLSSDNGGGYLIGPGDQIDTDPMLGPLQDNGGPTMTHALLPGSPAIDTGDPNFTPPPTYDQRGNPFVRVFNGRIDIGSFEVQPQGRPRPIRPRPTPRPRP
jgi:predicted outer membrane repeat protein